MPTPPKKIAIIGGGPAGLLTAALLNKNYDIHLFEKGKTLGRKFLVAGKGGFNLTNALNGKDLIEKYTPTSFFEPLLENFDSNHTRDWLATIGIPTFIGSSGRVFPEKGIKPIEVLNAIKNKLEENSVQIHYQHEFVDFSENSITFAHKDGKISTTFDHAVFALGGGSWSVTGSNDKWLSIFEKNKIKTAHFEASNCGLNINFAAKEIAKHVGKPLKNIAVSCLDYTQKGEAVISEYGLEGNAIYPIAALVRKQLKKDKTATIYIDLKPFNTLEELQQKISAATKPKNYAYLFKLNKPQLALLKSFTDKETYIQPENVVKALKKLPIDISSLRIVEEAISTVGGLELENLNPDLSLKKHPHIYAVGEMLNWDTITGGFLLQGCFSTAAFVSKKLNEEL